jgi:hypothetical protein
LGNDYGDGNLPGKGIYFALGKSLIIDIKDGDTIGPDAATKIGVRHEASAFVPGQPVYRLYFHGKRSP